MLLSYNSKFFSLNLYKFIVRFIIYVQRWIFFWKYWIIFLGWRHNNGLFTKVGTCWNHAMGHSISISRHVHALSPSFRRIMDVFDPIPHSKDLVMSYVGSNKCHCLPFQLNILHLVLMLELQSSNLLLFENEVVVGFN